MCAIKGQINTHKHTYLEASSYFPRHCCEVVAGGELPGPDKFSGCCMNIEHYKS